MSEPRYTSRNQFANMLERRVLDLSELSKRMGEVGLQLPAQRTVNAARELELAAKWLRDRVKS